MSVAARFEPGQFRLTTRHASGPLPRLVEGWSDGTFVIEKREGFDENCDRKRGFVVSHLRTGYAVFGVFGSREYTQSIVKGLHSANWNFDTPEGVGHDCKLAAQAAFAAHQWAVVSASDFDAANYIDDEASAIEARRAATGNTDAVHESAASEAGDAQ